MDERLPTPFERRVLELMLDGTSEEARILQAQAAVAEVTGRSGGSGAGIWFHVPDYAERLRPPASTVIANLTGVVADRSGRELHAFFLLHIGAGELAMLEIIADKRPWPEEPQLRSHSYTQRGRNGLILPRR